MSLTVLYFPYEFNCALLSLQRVFPETETRDALLKGMAHYNWPSCLNKSWTGTFYLENIVKYNI